jgi:aspartate aminotransferase-like enzyme
VVLNERALDHMSATKSSSFACDLAKWRQIMAAYEGGGHAYHATMPTDGLASLYRTMQETTALGLDAACAAQRELGAAVRGLLEHRGFRSVAADAYKAPGVVVSYTSDPELQNGKKFLDIGFQIAAGVPLQCGEGPDFMSFRLGLFGLDKLRDVAGSVQRLESAFARLGW